MRRTQQWPNNLVIVPVNPAEMLCTHGYSTVAVKGQTPPLFGSTKASASQTDDSRDMSTDYVLRDVTTFGPIGTTSRSFGVFGGGMTVYSPPNNRSSRDLLTRSTMGSFDSRV